MPTGEDVRSATHALSDTSLHAAATAAVTASRQRHAHDHGATLAAWESHRRRRPTRLQRAVDSVPYLGPALVAFATSIWLYDLLLLTRHLVLER